MIFYKFQFKFYGHRETQSVEKPSPVSARPSAGTALTIRAEMVACVGKHNFNSLPALQASYPDFHRTLSKLLKDLSSGKTQLSAYDLSVSGIPVFIAHCAPFSIM